MKQHESGLKRIGERKPPLCSVAVVDCIISRRWVTSAGKEVLTMNKLMRLMAALLIVQGVLLIINGLIGLGVLNW